MARAFIVVCPTLAALILASREDKTAGVTGLLKRSCDYPYRAAGLPVGVGAHALPIAFVGGL